MFGALFRARAADLTRNQPSAACASGDGDGDNGSHNKGLAMRLSNQRPMTDALIKAVKQGHVGLVKIALDAGANPNARATLGYTALHWAAQHNRQGICALILRDASVDVDTATRALDGRTALMIAASENHCSALAAFLGRGGQVAELNLQSRLGLTALAAAASRGHVQAISMLLRAGALVDIKDTRGWTALMQAVTNNHIKAASVLLKGGADSAVQNDENLTAFKIARAQFGMDCPMITTVLKFYSSTPSGTGCGGLAHYGIDEPAFVDNDDMFFCGPQYGHPGILMCLLRLAGAVSCAQDAESA